MGNLLKGQSRQDVEVTIHNGSLDQMVGSESRGSTYQASVVLKDFVEDSLQQSPRQSRSLSRSSIDSVARSRSRSPICREEPRKFHRPASRDILRTLRPHHILRSPSRLSEMEDFAPHQPKVVRRPENAPENTACICPENTKNHPVKHEEYYPWARSGRLSHQVNWYRKGRLFTNDMYTRQQ